MKKLALIALTAILVTACDPKNGNDGRIDPELAMSRDSLNDVLNAQDSLIVLMAEISHGMDEIKSLENIINSPNPESINRRQQIREDMRNILRTLNERKQRLEELEARLNKSNANNSKLKSAIESLKSQIEEQTNTIASLQDQLLAANTHIEKLNQDVDSLNQEIVTTTQEKEAVIEQNVNLANELNTCYYAIGSKKELKEHKIIESGFLKKTKIMPSEFEKNYFTKADKRTLTSIPLHSGKAKVLTNQPTGSFQFDNNNGMLVLRILDPEQFWGTSNYVVIQIN